MHNVLQNLYDLWLHSKGDNPVLEIKWMPIWTPPLDCPEEVALRQLSFSLRVDLFVEGHHMQKVEEEIIWGLATLLEENQYPGSWLHRAQLVTHLDYRFSSCMFKPQPDHIDVNWWGNISEAIVSLNWLAQKKHLSVSGENMCT